MMLKCALAVDGFDRRIDWGYLVFGRGSLEVDREAFRRQIREAAVARDEYAECAAAAERNTYFCRIVALVVSERTQLYVINYFPTNKDCIAFQKACLFDDVFLSWREQLTILLLVRHLVAVLQGVGEHYAFAIFTVHTFI